MAVSSKLTLGQQSATRLNGRAIFSWEYGLGEAPLVPNVSHQGRAATDPANANTAVPRIGCMALLGALVRAMGPDCNGHRSQMAKTIARKQTTQSQWSRSSLWFCLPPKVKLQSTCGPAEQQNDTQCH
ncbi:MAG: hypothetical protein CRU78_10555 [Candidatus Accumulibacter phosphatis]|uniref:Uncharacterized protein n=1 Tax=Candidatus Accumulibacter phosphatis TaxID=327160 RepID=A0A6A7RU34_9PROT|nr:hypothetical protein [Candidatus Accumulibacter phosphatis]